MHGPVNVKLVWYISHGLPKSGEANIWPYAAMFIQNCVLVHSVSSSPAGPVGYLQVCWQLLRGVQSDKIKKGGASNEIYIYKFVS
jgi:hypothetical protein